ncbi:MAG: hypothetical protein EA374_00395 [Acholeplasmatales bacterium]|nr:MAG: hypothetical protein EA374_00395 [Acholeplasmatales bacterium]
METVIKHIVNHPRLAVVCPVPLKRNILKRLREEGVLVDIRWFTRESLTEALTVEQGDLALLHAVHHLKTTPAIAAAHLHHVQDVSLEALYDDPVLARVQGLKAHLLTTGHLTASPTWAARQYPQDVFVVGYHHTDPQLEKCLQKLPSQCTVTYASPPPHAASPITLYEAVTEEDEVMAIAEAIAKRLAHGTPTEHIKIHCTQNSYLKWFDIVFDRFNLKINAEVATPFKTLELYRAFKQLKLDLDASVDTVLETIEVALKPRFAHATDLSRSHYNHLIKLLNPYVMYQGPYRDVADVIDYQLVHKPAERVVWQEGLAVGDFSEDRLEQEDCLFVPGFNMGDMPKARREKGLLDAAQKAMIGAPTEKARYRLDKTLLSNMLQTPERVFVSYRQFDENEPKYLAPLLKTLARPYVMAQQDTVSVRHSFRQDRLTFAKLWHTYQQFGVTDPRLEQLYHHERITIPTRYENQFKMPDSAVLKRYLQTTNHISTTRLMDYFECPFKFFYKHVIKLKETKERPLGLYLGQFFHDVLKDYQSLADADKRPYVLEAKLKDFMQTISPPLSASMRTYLSISLTQLDALIAMLFEIDDRSAFEARYFEEDYAADIAGAHPFELSGKIDKVMQHTREAQRIYLVDYKTGFADFSFDYIHRGLHAQLFLYLLLLRKHRSSSEVVGWYYQTIYAGKVLKAQADRTYDELLRETWNLKGYTLGNRALIDDIDHEFEERKTIKGLATNKDGDFKKQAKLFDPQALDAALNDFENLVAAALTDMARGRFPVRPVYLKEDILNPVSCKFCAFNDLCFKQFKDYEQVRPKPLFGGDEDDA